MGKVTRKLSVFLLLAMALVFAGSAEAARRSFGSVSIDVPKGWQVEESDEQLTITAPDESAALSIVTEVIEGATMKDVAEATSKEMKGSKPKAAEGGFAFTCKTDEGVDCNVFVTGDEDEGIFIIMIVAGEHPDMEGMLNSFEIVG